MWRTAIMASLVAVTAVAGGLGKVTFKSGKTARAEVVRYEHGKLTLRDSSGKTVTGNISHIASVDFADSAAAGEQERGRDEREADDDNRNLYKVTLKSGKTARVEIVRYEHGKLTLRDRNGKTVTGNISQVATVEPAGSGQGVEAERRHHEREENPDRRAVHEPGEGEANQRRGRFHSYEEGESDHGRFHGGDDEDDDREGEGHHEERQRHHDREGEEHAGHGRDHDDREEEEHPESGRRHDDREGGEHPEEGRGSDEHEGEGHPDEGGDHDEGESDDHPDKGGDYDE